MYYLVYQDPKKVCSPKAAKLGDTLTAARKKLDALRENPGVIAGDDCEWYSDGSVSPDHPAFVLAERSYRRGATHALAELLYCEDIPSDVKEWLTAYFKVLWKWRGKMPKIKDAEPMPQPGKFPGRTAKVKKAVRKTATK